MGLGDGRYRHEVSAADQKLVDRVGIGPSDWFGNSHDAMPVYPPALAKAIRLLKGTANPSSRPESDDNGLAPGQQGD